MVIAQHARETALKQRWNESAPEVEALLHRDRYRRLHDLLTSGRVEIRVVPKDRIFIHGKAGVIEDADGTMICSLARLTRPRAPFATNYEILWEDLHPRASRGWRRNLRRSGQMPYPLPDAIIDEIDRVTKRVEIRFGDAEARELPAAALAEAPIYRSGEQLQPGSARSSRLSLSTGRYTAKHDCFWPMRWALGKTLSLVAGALVSCLLEDGPVLILCPATLTFQWQVSWPTSSVSLARSGRPRTNSGSITVDTRFACVAPRTLPAVHRR